jgi:uncharacterized phage protein (TIGR01671 family)
MVDLKKITPLALSINPMSQGARIGIYVPDDDRIPVMQFTGLLDKNGKEIYEGDILKWKCSHGKISGSGTVKLHTVTIQWGHLSGGHGYTLTIYKNGEKYATEKSYWNDSDREIIGNIYENPELLV